LRSALEAVGVTTVLVTHEQDEAFALGDVVAVLRDGRLEQFGTAPDLYERPDTHFVATFVGRGTTVAGMLTTPDRARVADGEEWPVRVPDAVAPGAAVRVVVRPEALRLGDQAGVPGTVRARRYLGGRALFTVETAIGALEVEAPVDAVTVGAAVRVTAMRAHAFPAEDR
jgi:ABC-type Fe3+/spermidine/putrescine transport system ATPase subunit